MNGLQLSGMDMSDMLDVIHVILEDDITSAQSGEHIDAKDKVRTLFYREFYDKTYILANKSSNRSYVNLDLPLDEEIKPFDPKTPERKPYFPPTQINEDSVKPFGDVLDAPLG
jgi:hypothetical protein